MGNLIPEIYVFGGNDTMKIKSLSLHNICGIKHLDLNFNSGLNLICGANGVGKTTILKAIAHQFMHGEDVFIKKYYNTEKGIVKIEFTLENGKTKNTSYEVKDFVPGCVPRYNSDEISNDMMYFPSSRNLDYYKISSLPSSDTFAADSLHSSKLLITGVKNDIKNWFVSNMLFSRIEDSLNEYKLRNLELSKHIFTVLDDSLHVKTIRPDYEIVLNSGGKEIFFEMLSDGYKSCVFILLGIIKEVESRYTNKNACDFSGVIMIDEIDLHLHPQWQAQLVYALRSIFPKAQIIATTHSPSVLQNASQEEIIPLCKDDKDNTYIKELHLGKYGLQGWTLEEILIHVMGMPSTTSKLYIDTMRNFDRALDDEDQDNILKYYDILKDMLHPHNPLNQILDIQVAEWKECDD